jgi:4a-hydroxytetrahydrobiopterin dehydratase
MSTAELAKNQCVPCRGGIPPLKGDALQKMFALLGNDWQVVNEHHLEKQYSFPNWAKAMALANKVSEIAEQQNHHPDLYITWGKTKVQIWTHKIDGLTESDFYFAAKVEDASKSIV